MRTRTWIFAAVVALAFAINLGLLSSRVAQTGEDTVRARLAQSASGLHAQLELIDARLSPRAAAAVPELAEAMKPPADPTQTAARPDDRALRAAASALVPEPDLLAVVNAKGGLVSRRSRPAQTLDDLAQFPLAKAALDRGTPPTFAVYDGVTYRVASARVPGNGAAVIAGTAVDDRLAAQLKTQVDAEVTLVSDGKVIASSLPADERERVLRWAAALAPGYGVLPVYLPAVGTALSGRLPFSATRYAVRGTLSPLDGGVQAALTVPASPYLGWLARYQAFYLLGLLLFVILGFLWGLFSPKPQTIVRRELPAVPTPRPLARGEKQSLIGTDAGEGRAGSDEPTGEVPWTDDTAGAPADEPPGDHSEPAVVFTPIDAPAEPLVDIPTERSDDLRAEPSAEQVPAHGEEEMARETEEIQERPGEGVFSNFAESEPARPVQQGEAEWAAAVDSNQKADAEALAEPDALAEPEALREPEPPAAEPFAFEPEEPAEADEAHWHDVFEQFLGLKDQLGEPGSRMSYEKFAARLAKNRADLMARHQCRGVRFSVYEKEGKASIKASVIR